ncbi:glycoside hydrolase family 31 protein [Kocuria nitroreducens]|uniref:glycoside hydrolase family 31 protein n=1 Tax=Kocuria nitroreducens TaxID=3058914 RepID=UPI0036DF78AD
MPLPHFLPTGDGTVDPGAVVAGEHYRISVLSPGLLRLEYSPAGRFEDRPSAFAVDRRFPVPDFRVQRTASGIELLTERIHLSYDERAFSPTGLSAQIRGGVTSYHSVWRYGAPVPTLGGTARTRDEADGPVALEPGVTSREGFGVIDDSTSVLLTDDGWYAPRAGEEGAVDLYFFGWGHDHQQALRDFYALSGPQPVLPRWALGNWWSRYHAYDEAEYRQLVAGFDRSRLPFSVLVVDMDWHLTDEHVERRHGSGWTGYTWNRELFPDPRGFLAWAHERGYRVTLNLHPADGVRSFEDPHPAMLEALGREPGSEEPVAFDVTDRDFVAAYFDVLHRGLEADGVDIWWVDWQSGPYSRLPDVDPLWVLNHYHFLDSGADGSRPLTLSRYAGPGSHRYPVGFSGDTVISWASLAFQPYFTATAANIGFGWWSHDIGGHICGARDDELATRWLQFGVFSPILRLHSGDNDFIAKEPWRYRSPYAEVMERGLRLRHRLVPYLHTANRAAAVEGIPLVRPLYHEHPEAEQAYRYGHQYLFGAELMVAPVTSPADPVVTRAAVPVWLPEGSWTDLFTGTVYDGGRELVLHRGLGDVPVLARAGAIVPLAGPDDDAAPDIVNPVELEVLVVAGASHRTALDEDDDSGDGRDPVRWARTPLAVDIAAGEFTVGPAQGHLGCLPAARTWVLTFLGFEEPAELTVTVDGKTVPARVARRGNGVHGHRTSVTVDDVAPGARIVVRSAGLRTVAAQDPADRVFDLLNDAQISYEAKRRVHEAVRRDPVGALGQAPALGVEGPLLSALTELVLAARA